MHLRVKSKYQFEELHTQISSSGYQRVPLVLSPGDYAIRGSIIDIFPANQNLPLRIEFFDDEIEEIRTFDPSTQLSISQLQMTNIEHASTEHKITAHVIPHDLLFDLKEGDNVVHIHHGIGIYSGLKRLFLHGYEGEYALITYQDNDKIFVPIEQLSRIFKYTGGGAVQPNSLRDNRWNQTREKVKKAVKNVAKDLFYLYKMRKANKGYKFNEDTELDIELEETFLYEETKDQLKAINQVKADMESVKTMDRLICGDVGFGKTEVAIRASLKAVVSKKQVAILTPTTLLSKQHYTVFSGRLKTLGVNIEYLNRFKTKKEQKQILQELKDGKVDIVIGTHRLLQKDIEFFDLGLLVVDEEQRFGVMAKEKIKQLRLNVDVLTLSATPLPRTLYLSISGIRDISVINTPPLCRLPIVTEVNPYSMEVIKEKIMFEVNRGGQVFFLHNKVMDIIHLQQKMQILLPGIDIRVAHGQMNVRLLEKVMLDFYDNKFEVLLSTTIIENGIDIPNVHTIIIDKADRFGLAQLHQLRGRVGRDSVQSYCYLLYDEEAIMRLNVQERFDALIEYNTLGAGYDIALRDLELRGIGNILGVEQSGYMETVGFDLYMHLLNEAIGKEKGIKTKEKKNFILSEKTAAYIAEEYIPDMNVRLDIYKRIASIETTEDIVKIKEACEDRFGELPMNLLKMLEVIEEEILEKS